MQKWNTPVFIFDNISWLHDQTPAHNPGVEFNGFSRIWYRNTDVEESISEYGVDIGLMTTPSTMDNVSCKPVAEEALLLVTPAEVEDSSWVNTVITETKKWL